MSNENMFYILKNKEKVFSNSAKYIYTYILHIVCRRIKINHMEVPCTPTVHVEEWTLERVCDFFWIIRLGAMVKGVELSMDLDKRNFESFRILQFLCKEIPSYSSWNRVSYLSYSHFLCEFVFI
jgi:hypothetical protein